MEKRITGKVAVVTGGASGIGKACVERLASEGAQVFCVDVTVPEVLPDGVQFLSVDVADENAIEATVSAAIANCGHIDVLVNNAGIGGSEHVRIHEMSLANWDKVQAVNTRGTFAMLRAVIPHMLAAGGGSIINVASIGSFRATPRAAAYLASKGAMMMLTRAAAVEYAKDNIRVNAVCPSTTDTAILDGLDPVVLEGLVSRHPQGRLGTSMEVAALVAFLASDEAPHITEGSYLIDGGRSAT